MHFLPLPTHNALISHDNVHVKWYNRQMLSSSVSMVDVAPAFGLPFLLSIWFWIKPKPNIFLFKLLSVRMAEYQFLEKKLQRYIHWNETYRLYISSSRGTMYNVSSNVRSALWHFNRIVPFNKYPADAWWWFPHEFYLATCWIEKGIEEFILL